ncbi:MAG: beta-ketoacyl-[acyl-carrier-protein] synthase family protein [Nitrospirae bacterium]|nr:beta-ketoacyl-[acyl-carrier-protein] synthase family protein [Nitrospirota bacterium]
MRRVAVTGLGFITALGQEPKPFFESLMAGRAGIKRISADFVDSLSVKIAAEVSFDPLQHFSKKQLNIYDRTTQLSLIAASYAWKDSGIELLEFEKELAGVYFGTGLGGGHAINDLYFNLYKKEASRVSPLFVTKIMCNSSASHISTKFGFAGPCVTYSNACSSSALAIGEAYRQIQYGFTDVMLAGGAESVITYGSCKAWESLGVLAKEDTENPAASCRPFSKDRTGMTLGEGSGVVVLEEMERAKKRGATIYAELAGYGSTADAHHITSPSPDGQARAINQALREASINADGIDYINAHGTATIANDIAETQAIKKAFGAYAYKVPISSSKSMIGHLLGAAGAVEFAIALLAIKNKAVPPTANLRQSDPECDLDYVPNEGRAGINVRTIMANSFAFGGTNAVLVARAV